MEREKTNRLKDNLNHERAARTDSDILAVAQVIDRDLEAVAARARVVVDLQCWVKGHVLDLDLVVDRLRHGGCVWVVGRCVLLNDERERGSCLFGGGVVQTLKENCFKEAW